jgi:hypothetical protein
MSFKDLTNRESALDKAKGSKQPDKAPPVKDPASTPDKPQPEG